MEFFIIHPETADGTSNPGQFSVFVFIFSQAKTRRYYACNPFVTRSQNILNSLFSHFT